MFFCKRTFCAFRNPIKDAGPSCGWFHPRNNGYFYFKGENHEEAKGNVVDGSRRAGSGGSGIGCSSRLLRIRGLLCFLFW
jgi:hypothetical protein